jgi:hypothetical protein
VLSTEEEDSEEFFEKEKKRKRKKEKKYKPLPQDRQIHSTLYKTLSLFSSSG